MKKITALFILFVFIVGALPCYAEKERIYFTPEETTVDEIVEMIDYDCSLVFLGNTRKYEFNTTYQFDTNNLVEQKKAVKEFFNGVIELSKGEQDNYITNGLTGYNNVVWCRLKIPFTSPYGYATYDFTLKNDHISFWFGGFDIESPDALIDYIADSTNGVLSVLKSNRAAVSLDKIDSIDFKKNTLTSMGGSRREFSDVEKIEFDVTLDDSFEDTVFEEVADINDTIHCTVENIFCGHSIYILTIEGEKGRKQFFKFDYEYGFANGSELTFLTNYTIEGSTMIIANGQKMDEIVIGGSVKNNSVSGASVCIEFYGSPIKINPTNVIEAENVTYESYDPEGQFKSLRGLFGIPAKEVVIQQYEEEKEIYDIPEQDPERYVVSIKGPRNDGKVYDYSVNFIAELPLDTESSVMPGWYKKLGKNVKATLIGLNNTLDGKEFSNSTMIRFSGTKGAVWFENGNTIPEKSSRTENKVGRYYESLISFDGQEIIKNTVDNDVVEVYMEFSDTESTDIQSITINIGGAEYKIKSNEMKYIGGGKFVYEKLW